VWLTDNSDPGRGELYVGVTSLLLRQWQSQTRETVEHVRSVRRERRFVLPPSLSRSHGAAGFGSGPTGPQDVLVVESALVLRVQLIAFVTSGCRTVLPAIEGAKRAETSASVRSRADLAAPANSASARAALRAFKISIASSMPSSTISL